MTDKRLLAVHAHPDDETITQGATLARLVAAGVQVTVVTCTLGEEGDILLAPVAPLAAGAADLLGTYRAGELARAMQALGVRDHRYLGGIGTYRDSGMDGSAANRHPQAFMQAEIDIVAGQLADVIRELRPQVVVCYDEAGFYGHPDHIQAHRVTMRAIELAACEADRPAWRISKLYYTALARSVIADGIAHHASLANPPFSVAGLDDLPWTPDEKITTRIAGRGYEDAKRAALRAHATQLTVSADGQFMALSNGIGQPVVVDECYVLADGPCGPLDQAGVETDLFSGLEH